jgi:hypothetical protein
VRFDKSDLPARNVLCRAERRRCRLDAGIGRREIRIAAGEETPPLAKEASSGVKEATSGLKEATSGLKEATSGLKEAMPGVNVPSPR